MMTDGMLLAEIQQDPQLLEYDTVIVDEAHERHLDSDLGLALWLVWYLLDRSTPSGALFATGIGMENQQATSTEWKFKCGVSYH